MTKHGVIGRSIMEAVETLSSMAELDETVFLEGTRARVTAGTAQSEWTDPAKQERNRETIKQTFQVLHHYLRRIYEQEHEHLNDPATRQGIHAIMALANEAAHKVDRFTALFHGRHGEGVQNLPEFRDLQDDFKKILQHVGERIEHEEAWIAEWGRGDPDALDIQSRGLKDLEMIRRDRDYELFFIRKEDGRPFFNRNLVRHIRLVGNFDTSLETISEEGPFAEIRVLEDEECHETAQSILRNLGPLLDTFFKDAGQYKDVAFVAALTKAMMALMLAANSHNLLQHTNSKSSVRYFSDVQLYLREACSSEEYRRFLDLPPDASQPFAGVAMALVHALCRLFFCRKKNVDGWETWWKRWCEPNGVIIGVGERTGPLWVWQHLFDMDTHIRSVLQRYPHGPLLKILDVLNEGEDKDGFDPIAQRNWPYQLFRIADSRLDVCVLHLPCPTRQTHIHTAEIIPEYLGFLHACSTAKHLLIHLQDRTSWQEKARCSVLEELQKRAEFSETIAVVTLPKGTSFYLQSDEYEHIEDAQVFLRLLNEQIASGEECGFYFPRMFSVSEIQKFTTQVLSHIHATFFAQQSNLTRKNRMDFIEIFYLFLMVFLIVSYRPVYLSCMCKDGIDTGATTSAAVFSFLKILGNKSSWSEQEQNFLLWLLYAPALMLRERALDIGRLNRCASALSLIQATAETGGVAQRIPWDSLYPGAVLPGAFLIE